MKNKIYLLVIFPLILSCAKAATISEAPETLISAESITMATGDMFYDGEIIIDIDGDGADDGTVNYAYSRLGPTATCSDNLDCATETSPVITFYIKLSEKNLPINFMCESIGIYTGTTNQYRNLFCGPNTKLYWNGQEYIDKQENTD